MATEKDYHIHIHYTVHEETYRTIKRPEWTEERKAERESRCMVPTKTGKLKRCTEDCSKCKKFRSGTHFSIERMQENGMDTADQKADVEEALMYSELLNALMDLLDTLDPDKQGCCC